MKQRGIGLLLLVLLLYWGLVFLLVQQAQANTGGKFTYIYDDAYIHMAIADNLVEHGVWGVTQHEFTSTTSSPLWTLLLSAMFAVTGMQEIVPLFMNLLAGTALLVLLYMLLWRERVRAWLRGVALLLTVLLLPLPFLTLAGMEHVLHILLTLLFIYTAAGFLAGARSYLHSRPVLTLLILAPLLVMTRYEGLFLVALVVVLCLLRGRWQMGLLLLLAAALPVLVYGWVNLQNGWFFLPGSVIVKGAADKPTMDTASLGELLHFIKYYALHGLLVIAQDSVFATLMLWLAGFFALDVWRKAEGVALWKRPALCLLLTLGMSFMHFEFAAPFIRYYPYLIGAALLGIILAMDVALQQLSLQHNPLSLRLSWDKIWDINTLASGLAGFLLLGFALLPLAERAYDLFERIPGAMTNIHDQQYQMGRFVARYYDGERIVMNDIGTTSLMADVYLLDLVGLGTQEVAALVVAGESLDAPLIQRTAANFDARIAIVYDSWYDIPPEWIPVGYWTTSNAGFLGGDTVTFYAIDPAEEAALTAHLRDFQDELPERVLQHGPYTETAAENPADGG